MPTPPKPAPEDDKVTFNVRVPRATADLLRKAADAGYRTVPMQIHMILDEWTTSQDTPAIDRAALRNTFSGGPGKATKA